MTSQRHRVFGRLPLMAGKMGAILLLAGCATSTEEVQITPDYGQQNPDPWAAAITGDLDTLQRALEAGLSPDAREPNGSTPLILAAMFGQTDLVPFFDREEGPGQYPEQRWVDRLNCCGLFRSSRHRHVAVGGGR